MRRFECWWKWTKELKNKKQNKSRKRLKWLIHGNCIVTAILCWFHFFPKHVIISSTGKMTEQIWDVSADIVLKKKIVIRSISWPAVPLWSLLLLLLLTCFYSSPSNTRSSHCDGWMDEGKGGGSRPPPGSGFPPPPPSFYHLASPCALSRPPLAPSSPSLTIMSSSPLAHPDWLCTGMAAKRKRKSERGLETGPLPSVATQRSSNRILSKNRG